MFFYIKSNEGKYVSYDSNFKSYATINYNLVKSSGSTSAEISQCSASTYAKFLSLPELAGVPANMLYCPPIDFAKEIQTGDIEVTLSACKSTGTVTCSSDYR